MSIHKAHTQGACTNIGHAQGKSKDDTQSELGQQQSEVVAFWYFYVFSAKEILNTQDLVSESTVNIFARGFLEPYLLLFAQC